MVAFLSKRLVEIVESVEFVESVKMQIIDFEALSPPFHKFYKIHKQKKTLAFRYIIYSSKIIT